MRDLVSPAFCLFVVVFAQPAQPNNLFDRPTGPGGNLFDRSSVPLSACHVAAEVWASQEITSRHTNDIGPVENLRAQGIDISIEQVRRSDQAFCERLVEAQLQGFEVAAGRGNVEKTCAFIIEAGRVRYMQIFVDEGYHMEHAFHLSKFQTLLCLYGFSYDGTAK